MNLWVKKNKKQFEAEILKTFCDAVLLLQEQFERFRKTKTLSYTMLAQLLGEPAQKGALWRLKDNTHLTLRDSADHTPSGVLLDWAVGYIFHEVMKLLEDARLRQSYMPRLASFSLNGEHPEFSSLVQDLMEIETQTKESVEREIARVEKLFDLSVRLFCAYFFGKTTHRPLARLLYDHKAVISQVFGSRYDAFLVDIYGNNLETLSLEAACSLEESGRFEEALSALEECLAINPVCGGALVLKERLISRNKDWCDAY